jgi:hypothetical protein
MKKYITTEVCPSISDALCMFKIPLSLPRCRQPLIQICGYEQKKVGQKEIRQE